MVFAKDLMDRREIIVPRSNGEAAFLGFRKKWLLGTEMDKMVTTGRLSIHLRKAPKLFRGWGEGHIAFFAVVQ